MLPTVDDLKALLRLETTVDDVLLDDVLAQARASVEAYIRQPIEARAIAFTVYPEAAAGSGWGGYAGGYVGGYSTGGGYGYGLRLALPMPFTGTPTVTDADGLTVDAGRYTTVPTLGRITAAAGAPFAAGLPYRVTAVVGLSLREDYAEAVEPALSRAILDWAADLYQRRNPAASYESVGGGVAVNYNETASKTMPSRIRVTLDPWRRILV